MSTFDSNSIFNANCLSINSCFRSFIPWATENPKVINIPRNRNPAEGCTTDQKYQLNPLKIKYEITAIGKIRKGNKKDKQR